MGQRSLSIRGPNMSLDLRLFSDETAGPDRSESVVVGLSDPLA